VNQLDSLLFAHPRHPGTNPFTQRAAARLATEVATQQDGQGNPRSLPSPLAPLASASSSRRAVNISDPYR